MDMGTIIRAAAMLFGDAIKVVTDGATYVYEGYAFPSSRNPKPTVTDAVWYVRRRTKATGAVTVPVDASGNPLMGPMCQADDMASLSYYDPAA